MYNPHAKITYMHHTARCFLALDRWVIITQDHETVATVTTSTTNHTTEIAITLILGRHKLPLETIMRPGGVRTALRWVMAQLNNGNTWLSTRLALEHEARLLGYKEPKLLACEHAYDYQYCLQLLANLPGLAENWPKR